MKQELLEKVLRCPTLPSLPAVAVKVIELTQKSNVSLDELARTLQNDQGLAAKILRTVNSSFYGLRRPCSTINQALVMLGLSAVKSLALSFSLVSTLNDSASEEFDLVSYWRRGLYTAVAAKCVARAAGVLQEDEAFLGGLLQDVGIMALHQALGQDYLRVMLSTSGDHRQLARAELAAMELQHPEVGAMLVQRWRLPEELVVPVRYHECPTAAPREHSDIVRCVGLGNAAHDILTDADPGPALRRFHQRAEEWFSLDAAVADDLIRKVADGARQVASLFRLDTGPYADAEAVMATARAQAESLATTPEPTSAMGSLLSDSDEYDPLTGAVGHDALLLRGEDAFQSALAGGRSVAVIEIGIDGFDRIVQTGGPTAADAVLVEIAAVIERQFAKRGALVARSGDAAFTVLMPGVDRVEAVKAGSDLRARLVALSAGWAIEGLGGQPITASIGAAATGTDARHYNRVEQLFTAARRAMETASEGGGNNVRAFVPRAAA
jgi:diguanylate cyclase (GGDEF)-like protein